MQHGSNVVVAVVVAVAVFVVVLVAHLEWVARARQGWLLDRSTDSNLESLVSVEGTRVPKHKVVVAWLVGLPREAGVCRGDSRDGRVWSPVSAQHQSSVVPPRLSRPE